MDMLGIVLLWFANILTSIFNNDLVGEGKTFSVDGIKSTIGAITELTNIFAWVDVFVPVDFLLVLALLTTTYYSYKFVNSLVRYIIQMFK